MALTIQLCNALVWHHGWHEIRFYLFLSFIVFLSKIPLFFQFFSSSDNGCSLTLSFVQRKDSVKSRDLAGSSYQVSFWYHVLSQLTRMTLIFDNYVLSWNVMLCHIMKIIALQHESYFWLLWKKAQQMLPRRQGSQQRQKHIVRFR